MIDNTAQSLYNIIIKRGKPLERRKKHETRKIEPCNSINQLGNGDYLTVTRFAKGLEIPCLPLRKRGKPLFWIISCLIKYDYKNNFCCCLCNCSHSVIERIGSDLNES